MLRSTLICAFLALPFVGCSSLHDTPATKGATYRKETWTETKQSVPTGKNACETPPSVINKEHSVETFNQGENPSSRSTFAKTPEGEISMILGTGRANETIIPPPPDYTKYVGLVVSLLFLAGGIYLGSNGSPRLGFRLSAAGIAGAVVSMTIDQYGAFYAAAILLAGGFLAWENYKAYQKGLYTPTPTDADATK